MKTFARTLALSLALGAAALTTAPSLAEACGGYAMTDAERVLWALIDHLGQHAMGMTVGKVRVRAGKQRADAVVTFARPRGRLQQTFELVWRDGLWHVASWDAPTPVARVVAAR